MMLKKAVCSIQKPLALAKAIPSFFQSSSKGLGNDNDLATDFDFDFGKSDFTSPKPQYSKDQPNRFNQRVRTKKSRLLEATNLGTLTKMIEEGETLSFQYESLNFVFMMTELLQKSSVPALINFKKSKATEAFCIRIIETLTESDVLSHNLSVYQFYANLRDSSVTPLKWSIDRELKEKVNTKISLAIKNGLLSEIDLVRLIKSSIKNGDYLINVAYRALSQKMKALDEGLDEKQLSSLIFLIGEFNFSSDLDQWLRKLSKNLEQFSKGNIIHIANVLTTLKTFDNTNVSKDLIRTLEDEILNKIEQNDPKIKDVALKLLAKVPYNQIRRVREKLLSELSRSIKESPESLTYWNFSAFLELVLKRSHLSSVRELVDEMAEKANSNPEMFVDKIHVLDTTEITNACRLERSNHIVKKMFSKTIVEYFRRGFEQSKYINTNLLFHTNQQDAEQIIQMAGANVDKVNKIALETLFVIARIMKINIPDSLTPISDKAMENNFAIKQALVASPYVLSSTFEPLLEKLLKFQQPFKVLSELAYVFPSHAEIILAPLVEKRNLLKIFDTEPLGSIGYSAIPIYFKVLAENFKTSTNALNLVRLNRFINQNEFVQRFKEENGRDFCKELNTFLQVVETQEKENKSVFSTHSIVNIVNNTITDDILAQYNVFVVRTLIDRILNLEVQYKRLDHFVLIKRLNQLGYSAYINANQAYAEALTEEEPIRKYNIDKIVDHAFVSLQSYIKIGKLNLLDQAYESLFESYNTDKIGYRRLVLLFKITTKNDSEILEKLSKVNFEDMISSENVIEILFVLMQRSVLTGETALLENFLEKANNVSKLRLSKTMVLRIFSFYNQHTNKLSENEPLKKFIENVYHQSASANLFREYNLDMEPLIIYMVRTDKPLDQIVENPKTKDGLKSIIFYNLCVSNKQPELREKIFIDLPKQCIKAFSNRLDVLVEKVIIPLQDKEAVENIYQQILKLDRFDMEFKLPSVRYSLLWFHQNKPEVAEYLLSKSEMIKNRIIKTSFDVDTLAAILKELKSNVESPVLVNDIFAADLMFENTVIVNDSYNSAIKNEVLKALFPEKTIIEISSKDIRTFANPEQVQEYLKNKNIISENLTTEQKSAINEILLKKQQRLSKKNRSDSDNGASSLSGLNQEHQSNLNEQEISSSDIEEGSHK